MKKIIFILFLFLPFTFLFSQKFDNQKFEIIKETINFLSKDKNTFGNNKRENVNCAENNYDCLNKYVNDNKIIGADKLIRKWKDTSTNDGNSLKSFQQSVLKEITTGSDDKKNRTKLPEFTAYKTNVESLANVSDGGEPIKVDSLNAPPQNRASVENSEVNLEVKPVEEKSILPMLALILSILCLLGLGFLFFKLSQILKNLENKRKNDAENLDYDRRIQSQGEILKSMRNKLDSFDEKIKKMENDIAENKEIKSQFKEERKENPIVERAKTELKHDFPTPIVEKPKRITMYAKFPNLEGGKGFGSDVLTETQDGEQIYEMIVSDNEGTYIVSQENAVQKYALNETEFYLRPGCDFQNTPTPNCRINTLDEGTVKKSGSDWIIVNRAKIEFIN